MSETTTPTTWAERIPPFDEGNPIAGRLPTLFTADGQNLWRALVMGLAQQTGLPANATHAQITAAMMARVALTGEIQNLCGGQCSRGLVAMQRRTG